MPLNIISSSLLFPNAHSTWKLSYTDPPTRTPKAIEDIFISSQKCILKLLSGGEVLLWKDYRTQVQRTQERHTKDEEDTVMPNFTHSTVLAKVRLGNQGPLPPWNRARARISASYIHIPLPGAWGLEQQETVRTLLLK